MNEAADTINSNDQLKKAYAAIKHMIFHQRIVSGQRLIYRELAMLLNMSITPVRFALAMLEQEGFVERVPNFGYHVRKNDTREIEGLIDIRMIIEMHAVEQAIKKQTIEDVRLLEKMHQNHKKYKIQIYDRKKLTLDAAFHWQIARMSGNLEIVAELQRIFEKTYLRSPIQQIPPPRIPVAALEHEQILNMIKERDVARAKRYLGKHIKDAKEVILKTAEDSWSLDKIDGKKNALS